MTQKYKVKEELVRMYGAKCYYCDLYFSIRELTLDHIYPQSKRGNKGSRINKGSCVLACLDCNYIKSDRVISIEEFRQERMGKEYYPYDYGPANIKMEIKKIEKPTKKKHKKHEVWYPDMKNIKYPENPIIRSSNTKQNSMSKTSLWKKFINLIK